MRTHSLKKNDKKDNYALLLAGGQGSRFWPQSRTLEPKQFLNLHQNSSLFEQTIRRLHGLIEPENILIATSALYVDCISSIASVFGIPDHNIVVEPSSKNTAPSIALAAVNIFKKNPDAKLAVLPCDHLIKNHKRFKSILNTAFLNCDDSLIVFGISPHRPAVGYGYIKAGEKKGSGIFAVEKFCEKPDLKTAKFFLRDGRYYWNSGMFVGLIKKFLDEFKTFLPQHYNCILTKDLKKFENKWKKIPSISFDYGILERTKDVVMIKADGLQWSDLGSWQAWDEMIEKDSDGNAFMADVLNIKSRNTTIFGGHHLIAAIGLEDLIVVDTPDATLISKKNQTEDVKKIVEILKNNKRHEHYSHKTVRRPWGSYTVLDTGFGFKIKLVEVDPFKSLSLQFHKRRSEHWVVVEGRAKVTKGKKSYYVDSNESTFIPIGCIHRLTNPSNSILKIVEVQAGGYLEEDDITRLEDDFKRKKDVK